MVNKREMLVKEELEKSGWEVIHGGSPDFLAIKRDKEGNIVDDMFVEVKPEIVNGRFSDTLTAYQSIYRQVLERHGAFYLVRRVKYDDPEFNKRVDVEILDKCVIDISKTLLNEYEKQNTNIYTETNSNSSGIIVNPLYFKKLVNQTVARTIIGNITSDLLYDYLEKLNILYYKTIVMHELKDPLNKSVIGFPVNISKIKEFISTHTG